MAGYIFSLDNEDSLQLYIKNGVYATKQSTPSNAWRAHHEGIFGDYATMQEGDNIYFFIRRKIFGIGKLVKVGRDCKYFNFPNAGKPKKVAYDRIKEHLLWDEGEKSVKQRCLCLFEPDPIFFMYGVDMDDVLSSNPSAFKMLRAFWKLSFVKFDDEENQAFRDIILKRNQESLINIQSSSQIFDYQPVHSSINNQLVVNDYSMTSGVSEMLTSCVEGDKLRHEMAIEAGTLCQLAINDLSTCKIFGKWDYLSRQVIASPFKPIDYMDKMDLFGYSYVQGFKPTKAHYLVGEIKKDEGDSEAVDQILKYVDWVKDEYCYGDYSMINAFLICYNFSEQVITYAQDVGNRRYTIGMRPTQSLQWKNLKLVKYRFKNTLGKIEYEIVK